MISATIETWAHFYGKYDLCHELRVLAWSEMGDPLVWNRKRGQLMDACRYSDFADLVVGPAGTPCGHRRPKDKEVMS